MEAWHTRLARILIILCAVRLCLTNSRGIHRHKRSNKICHSWYSSVNIIGQNSIKAIVLFNKNCFDLPDDWSYGFRWTFEIQQQPPIPGGLRNFYCNCRNSVIPHCFNKLCDDCSPHLQFRLWRDLSITTPRLPTRETILSPTDDHNNNAHTAILIVCIATIIVVAAVTGTVFFRHSLAMNIRRHKCRCVEHCKTKGRDYNNITPNNAPLEDTPVVRKELLLLCEQNDMTKTITSALKHFNSRFTVDIFSELKLPVTEVQNIDEWVDKLTKVYDTIIVIIQEWMTENQTDIFKCMSQRLLRSIGNFDTDMNKSVILIAKNEEICRKFRSMYHINTYDVCYLDGTTQTIIPTMVKVIQTLCGDQTLEYDQRARIERELQQWASSVVRKKVLFVSESNERDKKTLALLREFDSYFTVDDICEEITKSPNVYDFADNVGMVYSAIIIVIQTWLLEEDLDNLRDNMQCTSNYIIKCLRNEHFQKRLDKYFILLEDGEDNYEKFRLKYGVNLCTGSVFRLSDMTVHSDISQMTELIYSICGDKMPHRGDSRVFIEEKVRSLLKAS